MVLHNLVGLMRKRKVLTIAIFCVLLNVVFILAAWSNKGVNRSRFEIMTNANFVASNTSNTTAWYTTATNTNTKLTAAIEAKIEKNPTENQQLITIDSTGRLGNNLFQYASLYGIARRYNFVPVISENSSLLAHVNRTCLRAKILSHSEWQNLKRRFWKEKYASNYDQADLEANLPGDKTLQLEFYLQSFRYFEGYEADVVSQFVFSQSIRDSASAFLQNVATRMPHDSLNSTIVGIHIRRGDYLLKATIKQGYNTPGEEYYVKAVRYFTDRYASVAFIVSSDDKTWAKNFVKRRFLNDTGLANSTIFELTPGHNPTEDLAVLSLTNHSILSAGTYSFWSAMLRQYRTGKSDNGTTIYYSKPFIINTKIAETYGNSTENFYPPSWIGMD